MSEKLYKIVSGVGAGSIALCGNQKVLDIPGAAWHICSIFQHIRKCDRLPAFRVYPSCYFPKNEQRFSHLCIRIYIKSDCGSDPAGHEGWLF